MLMIYGMKDSALPPGMPNTWDYADNDVTIYTVANAGHFVQQAASEKVTAIIKMWLGTR